MNPTMKFERFFNFKYNNKMEIKETKLSGRALVALGRLDIKTTEDLFKFKTKNKIPDWFLYSIDRFYIHIPNPDIAYELHNLRGVGIRTIQEIEEFIENSKQGIEEFVENSKQENKSTEEEYYLIPKKRLEDIEKSIHHLFNLLEKKDSKKEKLYTRSEVRDLLNVSDATLWRWDKIGIVNGKKIGNRRYYTEDEVSRLMNNK